MDDRVVYKNDQHQAGSLQVTDDAHLRTAASSTTGRRSVHTSRFSAVAIAVDNRCITKRQRGIAVTMALFATITSAQFVAAFAANSLALLGDCASMAVDTLSYGANLYAECSKTSNHLKKERNQLIASFISILVLLGITGWVISDAVGVLTEKKDSEDGDDDDVNPYIVFAFALGGLLFDFAGLFFLWLGQKKEKGTGTAGDLNMKTACLHVFADSLRSTTTLVESILIWFYKFDGEKTDAIAALCVSALIVLPCFGMIHELYHEWKSYQERRKGVALLDTENAYHPLAG